MKQFVNLMLQHQRRIHAYILYQIPHRFDAEDVLQETLTEMFDKFDTFEEGSNFLAWGLTIAKYKILAYFRDTRKCKLVFDQSLLDLLEGEAESHLQSLGEETEALNTCMKKLREREKKILKLRYESDLSYRSIAKQFSVSMQAICKAMNRIHAQLMRCIHLSLTTERS